MKPLLANWTIVLAGRWNIEILNPDWVTQTIFGREKVGIDLVMEGMQTRIRYKFDNLSFVPTQNNVVFSVYDTEDESLAAIESAACKLLSALPVTPITALGINFTFIETEPPLDLLRIFNLPDTAAITEHGGKILRARVRREIAIEDRQLNLLITQLDDGSVRIALNYHFPTNETSKALEKLDGHVCRLRHHGEEFLSKVYSLSTEGAAHE